MTSRADQAAAIRPATAADAAALAAIYNHYILHTRVTFEESPVDGPELQRRMEAVSAAGLPWLVAEAGDGTVAGYACAGRWNPRPGYRYAAEVTIYLAPEAAGRGLGTRLYHELLDRLRALGLRTALGGIGLPNPASVALHEKLGFRPVARYERIGIKFGEWMDVGYWQLHL